MSKKSTQISKKVLASALSAAMVVAFAPAVALADDTGDDVSGGAPAVANSEHPVDSTQLTDADADGVITVNSSGNYYLASDFSGSIVVEAENVSLYLNNVKVTATKSHAITSKASNLTIYGGTIDGASVENAGAIYTAPGASTTVQSSVLTGSKWYVVKNLGTMILTQVKLTQNHAQSSGIDNGYYGNNVNDCNQTYPKDEKTQVWLTINGGDYSSGMNVVKNDDYGFLKITDGLYHNTDGPAILNWNVATIENGTFEVNKSDASVLAVGSYNNKADQGVLDIKGGTFKALAGGGLFGYGKDGTGYGTINISGGFFTGDVSASQKVTVTAGTFSDDPSAYVANGSVGHKGSDGTYYVHAANEGVTSSSGSAATCTAAGYTGSTYCSIDGYVYSSNSTIPALGHEYTWVTTTPATESAEGIMTGTCSRCGSTITSPIPKLPASGSNETATDSSGAKIDVTIDTNESVTLPDGTQAAGTATYEASESDAAKAEVVIPSTVAVGSATYVVDKIADSAFEGQEQLTSVTIPDTVVEIGASAFAGTSVASVTIPESTTVIGEGAFKGCSSLESVDIKGDVTKIAADTFAGTALTSVDIPDSVATIGARAFADSLIKTVSSQATTVSKSAFAGCSALKSVDLPKVETIGKSVFKGAGLLKSVTTGTKLASIGKKAFAGTSVKKLVLTSKKLTASSVAGSLKGSSVVKVVVKVSGSKKAQEKIVDKYTKAFAKKNSGKKVKVVAAK